MDLRNWRYIAGSWCNLLFKVSLSVTFKTIVGFTPVFTAAGISSMALIRFKTTTVAVAVVQLMDLPIHIIDVVL
jgi:hypothetical protein